MKAKYDIIGGNYAKQRKSDPRIASQIHSELVGATKIINIGAGSGSYEPMDIPLMAIEPSSKMIAQRPKGGNPVIQGTAENLPFKDNAFSHAMTVLSMHHWSDQQQAFKEINRVTTDSFIAVSWNPESNPFWLTRDYFPEIFETDKKIFPYLDILKENFGTVEVKPLLIPHNCIDGFLAAYWKRPEAYLDQDVRNSISTFSKLKNIDEGLTKLKRDFDSGAWERNNKSILSKDFIDAGYILITAKIKP